MANGLLIETDKDWITVRISRKLISAKKRVVLTMEKALEIFKKGEKEYRAGKLKPISSLNEIL